MNISITNNSGATKTYLGTITVATGATVSVTDLTSQLALATDGALRVDAATSAVFISDGISSFSGPDAIVYLYQILQNLGPSSGFNPVLGVAGLPLPGIVPTNSTAAVLAANGTFTGTFYDASLYSTLNVTVFTDQTSATNGLIIEHSSDGTNIDDNDLYSIVAGNGQQFSLPIPLRYFRVRYVNGATIQTMFRLQSKVHIGTPKPSSHRLGDILTTENDAELVKASLMGQKADTTFGNARLSNNNEQGVTDVINVATQQRAQSVTATAAEAMGGATRLVNRKFIRILPTNGTVYWGPSGVTVATGEPVYKNQGKTIAYTDNVPVFLVSAGTVDVRITEGS